jgi:UDP-3-O-[3-hydroxymyristoyl] glucosamine N-acyltransferase
MLTANTVISGSTTVGENAWLAPGTLLNNSIEVGDDCFTGIGTVVTKDAPGGKIVVGAPAKILRDRY